MHESNGFLRRHLGAWIAIAGTAIASSHAASASADAARIAEILAGANGDARIQFIELDREHGLSCWGPQRPGSPCFSGTVETHSRLRLVFFDAAGRETGQFLFPSEPRLARKVLVATAEFAALAGAPPPDFVMPPLLNAVNGKVCLAGNARNARAPRVRRCVSYGQFAGDTERGGPPAPRLEIMHTQSLRRVSDGDRNCDFAVTRRPSPTNAARATFTMRATSLVAQGESLFMRETFQGNGRTCVTCHEAGASFGLRPFDVGARFNTLAQGSYDPLFIAETAGFDFNLNTLTVAAPASPGDLTGILRGATGQAKVLARTGPTTYLVYGGVSPALTGTVTDGTNSAAVVSVVAGDLDHLEDPRLMRLTNSNNALVRRSLILENIDGFDRPPVFRKSPHLLNLKGTAPYGFSAEFADLRTFSQGAVSQHFPRTLARVPNVDFRPATDEELKALEAFQLSLEFPAGNDPDKLNLDRFATTTSQRRGRALFFGEAKCSRCHNGPMLNETDGTVGKPAGPAKFNTGITRLFANEQDAVPPEPGPDGTPHRREFDTPTLFNVQNTSPLFHDGSISSVPAGVLFYQGADFNDSPAGVAVGGIELIGEDNNLDNLNSLIDFVAGLVERPYSLSGGPMQFEDRVVGGGPGASREVVITNVSSRSISFRPPACVLTGPDRADFVITSCPIEGRALLVGESRTITVAFAPNTAGAKTAVLEVLAFPASGIDLSGTAVAP
jgi:cytochrome c peroxidase